LKAQSAQLHAREKSLQMQVDQLKGREQSLNRQIEELTATLKANAKSPE
jgi:chaperonin cofactor prefoldin